MGRCVSHQGKALVTYFIPVEKCIIYTINMNEKKRKKRP